MRCLSLYQVAPFRLQLLLSRSRHRLQFLQYIGHHLLPRLFRPALPRLLRWLPLLPTRPCRRHPWHTQLFLSLLQFIRFQIRGNINRHILKRRSLFLSLSARLPRKPMSCSLLLLRPHSHLLVEVERFINSIASFILLLNYLTPLQLKIVWLFNVNFVLNW